jgi:dienelactone hydrolase
VIGAPPQRQCALLAWPRLEGFFMGRIAAVILVAVVAGTASAAPAPAPTPEPVEIPHGEAKLKGFLYRPEGSGPFPAVVALHGCEGLAGMRSPLGRRYRDWGERLVAAGFVVVFPDSFGARKLGPQCNAGERRLRSGRERVGDAEAVRQWLQEQAYVAPDRISLLGWANGGVAALWTVRPRTVKDGKPDFRSAVAIYPGCRRLRDTAWSARMPTLILVGAKDDWMPSTLCEQMVAGARGRSAQAAIVVYPSAHHNFDHPNLPLQQRSGIALATGAIGRVHVGTDTAARNDVFRRVPEWLAR